VALTINAGADLIATFDAYRKKRDISGYERVGMVSETDADGMRKLALELRDLVISWLRRHHPALLPEAKPKRAEHLPSTTHHEDRVRPQPRYPARAP